MRRSSPLIGILATAAALHAAIVFPQSPALPSPDPWPETATSGPSKFTIRQPQVDAWDQYRLQAPAAVSGLRSGSKAAVFGVIEFEANTHVGRASRTVEFHDIKVTQVKFPTVPDASCQYQQELQTILTSGPATMPLDRLEADMSVIKAETKAKQVTVMNSAPVFILTQPA